MGRDLGRVSDSTASVAPCIVDHEPEAHPSQRFWVCVFWMSKAGGRVLPSPFYSTSDMHLVPAPHCSRYSDPPSRTPEIWEI